MPKLNGVYKLH